MDGAAGARRAMTGGLVVDAGGVLMRAQPRCLSKPMHSESNVEPMVRTVAQVPWARHDVGHTRDFDAMASWLTVRTSKSATCQLLRVAWRTVGRSSQGSTMTSRPESTASLVCVGSGSMRSPTNGGTAT